MGSGSTSETCALPCCGLACGASSTPRPKTANAPAAPTTAIAATMPMMSGAWERLRGGSGTGLRGGRHLADADDRLRGHLLPGLRVEGRGNFRLGCRRNGSGGHRGLGCRRNGSGGHRGLGVPEERERRTPGARVPEERERRTPGGSGTDEATGELHRLHGRCCRIIGSRRRGGRRVFDRHFHVGNARFRRALCRLLLARAAPRSPRQHRSWCRISPRREADGRIAYRTYPSTPRARALTPARSSLPSFHLQDALDRRIDTRLVELAGTSRASSTPW